VDDIKGETFVHISQILYYFRTYYLQVDIGINRTYFVLLNVVPKASAVCKINKMQVG
jgi:hypothetical protein